MTAAFSADEQDLLREAADAVVRHRLAVPAMMMLETVRPMNVVSSAMLQLVAPTWRIVFGTSRLDRIATLLERRDAIPELLRLIDAAEDQRRSGASSLAAPADDDPPSAGTRP